jgi:YrbI family 3-deoxy-D-manno-octulosonate 8-phosphate phosphatase
MDNPEVVVIDVDGCLTDGVLTIDHKGEKLFKRFHTRDVRAIRELIYNGVEVYLVSADDWAGTRHFAKKVGAEFIYMRNKADLLPQLMKRKWWAIGDDAWDIPLLKAADRCFCPADADPSVLNINRVNILNSIGGYGVVAEVVHHFMKCESS